MFTAYAVVGTDVYEPVVNAIKATPEAVLLGVASDLRQALSDCAAERPGILVLDDQILEQNPGSLAAMESVGYPIVLLIRQDDPATARRALAVRARDMVSVSAVDAELPGALARHAEVSVSQPQTGKVIVVFSSKGGVGKTTLAVNLSMALNLLSHHEVALVDLDLQFGDVAALLGDLPPGNIHDLAVAPTVDRLSIERVLAKVGNTDVNMLASPALPQESEDIRPELVVRVLQMLKETHAYVVVDTAPGFSDVNVAALDYADYVLTVLTPDVVTIRTIKQALDLFWNGFHYSASKVRLVLNRAGTRSGIEAQDIVGALGTGIFWELPSDGNWPVKAANQGRALMQFQPTSQLAQSIREMARAFIEEHEGHRRLVKEAKARRPSLFSRLGIARGRS
jgi:pilus assembly protein CpaE